MGAGDSREGRSHRGDTGIDLRGSCGRDVTAWWRRMSTRKNGALLAAAALISFGSMLLRPTGVRPWRSLWAEDGRDFLTGGLNHPPVIGWFRSYQGYQHVIPRMIGSLAALFPLDRAADVFAFASAGIAAVALVLFAVNLRPWLPATWMQ